MSKIYQNITRTSKNLPNRCLKPFIQACYYGVKKGPLANACGFTLIELLVVVLIIGILAAVALPQYQVAVTRARVAKALPLLRSVVNAKERYYMANGYHTADLDLLDIQVPYGSRIEHEEESWVYTDTPVGKLHVDARTASVFWGGLEVLSINFSPQSQTCFGWNKTGDRVCASYGRKIADHSSSSGWPVYQINF